jgi:hypothetical protein
MCIGAKLEKHRLKVSGQFLLLSRLTMQYSTTTPKKVMFIKWPETSFSGEANY